jgi:hypothetical protein
MQGALSYEDAHKIASKISTSALVKTALYGEDAKYDHLPPQDCFFNDDNRPPTPAGAVY